MLKLTSRIISYWSYLILEIASYLQPLYGFNTILVIIITTAISSNVIGVLAALFFTYHCIVVIGQLAVYRTIKAGSHTKSTQLNLPITELITITIAKKTGEFSKWRNFLP